MRSQSRPGICELKEAELVKPPLGGVQPLAEVPPHGPVGEIRHEGVHVGVGARLPLLATEGHGCFIRVEAGQLRGDGVHVFVLEDQYQIIKKFVF